MRRLYLFVVLALLAFAVNAQNGHYFLTHYKPGNDNISYLSFDIVQDNNGILYFANRSGVLQFDGRSWEMIPVDGAAYALAVTIHGDVYAGGSSGFGMIALNDKNQLSYLSLSDSLKEARNVFSAFARENTVYFVNEAYLFTIDSLGAKPRVLIKATDSQVAFTGLFSIANQLYLGTEGEGLKKIDGAALQASELKALQNTQLVFSEASPDGKTQFIATEDHRFFMNQEGIGLTRFQPKDSVYLTNNVVANCAWVTDKMLAIGTLRGGVVFMETDSAKTLEISNYYTGLPDNEVYALHTDHHLGIWMAHDYGFSRAAPFLPFRTFNHYPGVVGNLLTVQSHGEKVYVGTTLGLFLLSRDEIYEDEIYNLTQTITINTPPVVEAEQVRKKSKKGFLGLNKRKRTAESQVVTKQESQAVTKQRPRTVTRNVQKTRRVLKGIEHSYKRVEGVSGKVDQLMVIGERLVCAGVGGVHEVTGLTSTLLNHDPVRTIFYSKYLEQLLISTYGDEIKSFRAGGKGWERTEFPDSLSMYADYMFEDNLQNLWICSHDRALKVGVEEKELLDAESIPLPHTSVDRTVGLAFGQEVYLTQNGEFYHYASFKNQFVKYDSLPGPKKYFAAAGNFWFYDGHRWRTVDRKLQGTLRTEWLALFSDIRFLGPSEQGKSLWVITSDNELYKFSSEQSQATVRANPLFLKEVRSLHSRLPPRQSLLVDERESSLTLEFIQPEYVSLQAVEYRYWVKGLQTNWSEWGSLNNVINFPFLTPGKYNVMVQSKDLFGRITELSNFDFNVVPPYWKQSWFFALEFLFFMGLVVMSLRLKAVATNARYRLLNRFLAVLTVVLMIQFVQTIAESNITIRSHPVADFFIQVGIALLVLPVEEFLRKKMTKNE